MMYNTTENLLLAHAINFYGFDDSKIQIYIKSRSLCTDSSKWKQNYENLKKEAFEKGYIDLIKFCEEKRYEKLIQMYKEKVKLRMDILEGKIDSSMIKLNNEDNLFSQEVIQNEFENFNVEIEEEIENASLVDASLKFKEIQSSLEKIKQVENVEIENEEDLEEKIVKENDENPKSEKKYYLKMNENEREFDDYLDKIEEQYLVSGNVLESDNELLEILPALGKVKNKEERKKLLLKEIKRKKIKIEAKKMIVEDTPVKKYKRSITLEDQYRTITERVYGRKKQEKEKTAWVEELKTILKVMQVKVEGENLKDTGNIKIALKNILNDLSLESSMSGSILQILMIIQDAFFVLQDECKMKIILEFKKLLCFFFDFYRK
ncbi:hypothetical protein GVAV_002840 [Gurleya vavrai]